VENQLDTPSLSSPFFTSDIEIVNQAASTAMSTIKRWRKERLFFKKQEKGFWIDGQRGLGLSYTIRISHQPTKKQPSRSYVLLDFTQYPPGNPLVAMKSEPTSKEKLSMWRDLNKPKRKLTIHVGLYGVSTTKRSPYQKSYQIFDKMRFGKGEEPWMWRTMFIDPKRTPVDEIRFVLFLYLRQQNMISESVNDILCELVEKCFRIKDKGDAVLVVDKLLHNFTLPEDWKHLRTYVHTVEKNLNGYHKWTSPKLVMFDPDKVETIREWQSKAKQERGIKSEIRFYTMTGAAEQLRSKGYRISRHFISDLADRNKITCQQNKGKRYLDEKGLTMVRELLKRQEIMAFLIGRDGKTKEAARKYVYRYRVKGYSFEEILNRLKQL